MAKNNVQSVSHLLCTQVIKPQITLDPKKKGGGNRPPKGQKDPVNTFNRYGSLEEDAGMEVEASQTSLPSSLSGSTSSLK